MNDINKSLDQNIVLPKQLHYIIFLRNELYQVGRTELDDTYQIVVPSLLP